MKQSNFLSLNWHDLIKGLVMAALTPVFTTIYTSFEAGTFTLNWHLIGVNALGGAIAYLSKNFFTKPTSPQMFSKEIGLPKPKNLKKE
jgi:hypothetical protein